jgi:hypothetical protein
MADLIYWLEVDGDRTGLEVRVNGVPAERLLRTHGIKFPVNEYLRTGTNTVEVRPGKFPSNGKPGHSGRITVKVERLTGNTGTVLSREVLFQQTQEFSEAPVGQPLISGSFDHLHKPGLVLSGLTPIGPHHIPVILEELKRAARMLQRGDGVETANWMARYIREYCDAYPHEAPDSMNESINRMAGVLAAGEVRFNSSSVRLEPVAEGALVDCTSPEGAAVRVALPQGIFYDLWAIFGIQDGRAILVR